MVQKHKEVESKKMEKDTICSSNQERAEEAVLLTNKIDLKSQQF